MKYNFTTKRLVLDQLNLGDADFMLELLNTEGWLNFIGERHIRTNEQALNYIQKILDNPVIFYWVVKTKVQKIPLGIISYIKRDYLPHHDIGFAFLPAFLNQGYAYEAASTVLKDLLADRKQLIILATTRKDNLASINLLKRLGFRFDQEIGHEKETLQQYSLTEEMLITNYDASGRI